MLILTRRLGQVITVGDPASPDAPIGNALIEITIIEVRGGQVKIGITAPREMSVDRTEIRLEKQREDASHR